MAMHRSVLLLLMSTLLLSAAVGLPVSLESVEESSLEQLLNAVFNNEELLKQIDPSSHGDSIHRRAAKDSSSSSEEHKDKANSSDASSSEEQKSTTDHAAEKESTTEESTVRRRRQAITKANISGESASERAELSLVSLCEFLRDRSSERDEIAQIVFGEGRGFLDVCRRRLRLRRQVSGQDSDDVEQTSDELKLDAQEEKALDEEMARAVAEVKDNGSIEDYAQGCEVMEVSSKEANEATYAE